MTELALLVDPAGGASVMLVRGEPPAAVIREARAPQVVVGGFRGVPGQPGPKGEQGAGISVLGVYPNEAALIAAHPTGDVGQSYAVGGDLYTWDMETASWANAGSFRGPAGTPIVSMPVGAIVQGLRVVRASSGRAFPIDTTVDDHAAQVLGLALQSVTTIGDALNVQTSDVVSDSGWSWSDGAVYCGADGVLTQSPGSTGWLLRVGLAVTATSILIDIDSPIYRG